MKTNQLLWATPVFVLFIILVGTFKVNAQTSQYVTLTYNGSVAVQTNQIVSVVGFDWSDINLNVNSSNRGLYGTLPNGSNIRISPFGLSYSSGGSQAAAFSQIPQIVTGVTNVYFSTDNQSEWATIQITTPACANVISNYVPADAIVIPASATGNVQIILESSTDLVNWTAASPGTYGASSATNRFFRVRAVHN